MKIRVIRVPSSENPRNPRPVDESANPRSVIRNLRARYPRRRSPREREPHQVLAPDDLAVELLLDLVDDPLAHAWPIDLGEHVGQHQRLHARARCAITALSRWLPQAAR